MKSDLSVSIKGMHCASCVNRIQNKLSQTDGIISSNINLATESAIITYQSNKIAIHQIEQVIKDLGYSLISNKEDELSNQLSKKKEFIELIISLFLTIPLMLPMLLMLFNIHWHLSWWLQLFLAFPVQFYFGRHFYLRSYYALKSKTGNMDLLVSIGTTAAFILSLFHIWQYLFGHSITLPHLYFESSSMIISMVLFGKYLEKKSKNKTLELIKNLEKIFPKIAHVVNDGNIVEIDPSHLMKDQIILVFPDEQIPADGMILEGSSLLDESMLTGEGLPVSKHENDKVYAGTINHNQQLKIKVQNSLKESLIYQISNQVNDLQLKKMRIELLVDKISSHFISFVLISSFLTLIFIGIFSGDWETALLRAISVLVISCPCAMGLAVPTTIVVGTGLASKAGILIKDPKSFEVAHKIDTVVFDKTGTLTEGSPSLELIRAFHISENQLLQIASEIEFGTKHPYGKAILNEAVKRNLELKKNFFIESIPGKGIKASILDQNYFLTSIHVAQSMISEQEFFLIKEEIQSGHGMSILLDLNKNSILGFFKFKDHLKSESFEAISHLKSMKIKPIIISGDHEVVVKDIAEQLGIDQYFSNVFPNEKADIINSLKNQGKFVAMVGDGINDGPALATADVSLSMASGSELALSASDLTIMNNNPQSVIQAIQLSKKIYQKIKQNLFWAFIYNTAGIPLAMFGKITPSLCGMAMALSSVSVVLNSLMLKTQFSTKEKELSN